MSTAEETTTKPILMEQVRHWAETQPDHVALRWETGERTYAQLHERACRLANGLNALGLGAEDRIAILDKNGPAHIELLLGAPLIGAVGAPVNFRLAPREVVAIMQDAGSRFLIVGEEFAALADAAKQEIDGLEVRTIEGDYETWLAEQDADDPGLHPSRDDVACQLYSSGTTGLPKGVELTHGNLAASLSGYDGFAQFGPDSVNLACLPMFHIGGGGVALAGLYAGVTNRLVRDIVPNDLLDTIEQEGITHAALVPAVIGALLMMPGVEERDLSRWQMCLYGASTISPTMLGNAVRVLGCSFSQGYGLTETTGIAVLLPPDDHDPDGPNAHRLRAAGRPVNGMEAKIVSPDTLEDVPAGEIGEIWLRGPNVMKGYFGKPEETEEALVDGWFRSGDAGRMDDDGYIYIEDRVKDMIISGGENIYPFEIELVLSEHPAVADVAVIAVPSEKWGETPKAIVVLAEGVDAPSEEDLIAFTRENLARYKCPTSVDLVAEIPRSPTGKILKKELRAPFWEGQDRGVA